MEHAQLHVNTNACARNHIGFRNCTPKPLNKPITLLYSLRNRRRWQLQQQQQQQLPGGCGRANRVLFQPSQMRARRICGWNILYYVYYISNITLYVHNTTIETKTHPTHVCSHSKNVVHTITTLVYTVTTPHMRPTAGSLTVLSVIVPAPCFPVQTQRSISQMRRQYARRAHERLRLRALALG